MHRPNPGPRAALLVAFIAALTLGACGETGMAWDAKSVGETVAGAPFQPIIVNSNLGVGTNRFALALFDNNQELINTAEVKATFYQLDKEPQGEPANAKLAGEAVLIARTLKGGGAASASNGLVSRLPARGSSDDADAHSGHDSTVFAAVVHFDRAGFWGVSLDVKTGGQRYRNLRLVFAVQDRTLEPAVGEPAPATKQLTVADVKSIEEIDTSPTPNPDLHRITIADALKSGKPSVIAFVTPAFCQTRFCGPTLDQVVTPAWQEFKDRVNVLHVEPFDVAKAKTGTLELAPAVKEWKLLAEPMIFVVGKDGRVSAKFEGIMDYAEVREAIRATLSN